MKRVRTGKMDALKLFFKRSDGTSTIEFVILFPIILMLFLATVELGMLMVRQSMLEMAVDKTVRHLRLGHFVNPTQDDLRDTICTFSAIIPDCSASLLIELRAVDTTSSWNPMTAAATCKDRDEDISPVVELTPGAANELVTIRVCSVFKPMFPTTNLGMRLTQDHLGGYALVAKSAFVNEPS